MRHVASVDARVLRRAIARVEFARHRDPKYWPACAGIRLEFAPPCRGQAIATDGASLTVADFVLLTVEVEYQATINIRFKDLRGFRGTVRLVDIDGESLKIEDENGKSAVIGLIPDHYPDWRAVLPSETGETIMIDAPALLSALRELPPGPDEVHLTRTCETLLVATSPRESRAVPAEGAGSVDVHLDRRRLAAYLRAIGAEKVRMIHHKRPNWKHDHGVTIWRAGNDHLYVLMPIDMSYRRRFLDPPDPQGKDCGAPKPRGE